MREWWTRFKVRLADWWQRERPPLRAWAWRYHKELGGLALAGLGWLYARYPVIPHEYAVALLSTATGLGYVMWKAGQPLPPPPPVEPFEDVDAKSGA